MKAFITFKPLVFVCVCASIATALLATEPAWWAQRGILDPNKAASDFATLNQGQLKNFARAARDEMNNSLPGGAGTAVNSLVASWSATDPHAANYAVVNVGQLKAVALPFYDRLAAVGFALPGHYPWTGAAGPPKDYAPANIGQAKQVFSFDFSGDGDHDGIPDLWEVMHGLSPLDPLDASTDLDHDGLTNLQEFQHNTNPSSADSDGDGVPDGQEIADGTDPLDAQSSLLTLVGLRIFSHLEDFN